MRIVAMCLLANVSLLAQVRYARLATVEGAVEAQIHPSGSWRPALQNMPLLEASSIRTLGASRAEIELDEGSVLRLAENSSCELSDYTRLSTGQRITQISLDHGVAYFDGESNWRDALLLSLANARISIRRGSRVRLEAGDLSTQLAVFEGQARLTSALIELDVREGKMLKLDLNSSDRFHLLPEIAALESDTWSLARDKILAGDQSGNKLAGLRYGMRDLDAAGEWIDTAEFGIAWKPKVEEGWAPFRDGKWQWYDGLGYTWIGAEQWGWAPYHYGRWMLQPSQGWIWAPGARRTFLPGEVYWLRGSGWVGWGPLAPGESWSPPGTPTLYLKTSSTFARYAVSADVREIDPAGFTAGPADPLRMAAFLDSLPAPRISRSRLEYARDPDRPGVIRLAAAAPLSERARPQTPEPPVTQSAPPPPPPPIRSQAPPIVVVQQQAPAPEPITETYYAAPIFTGIIVMNPPEKKAPEKDKKKKKTPPPDGTAH